MQILEIWNNLFTRGLQIHSSFLSYLFLIFCELQKIKKWWSFVQIWWNLNLNIWSRFEKLLSLDFLEFTLIFLHIFLECFQFFKNFNIWIQKSPISNLGPDRSHRISAILAKFVDPDPAYRLLLPKLPGWTRYANQWEPGEEFGRQWPCTLSNMYIQPLLRHATCTRGLSTLQQPKRMIKIIITR
jgi:hypothetical protein